MGSIRLKRPFLAIYGYPIRFTHSKLYREPCVRLQFAQTLIFQLHLYLFKRFY